jgi:energy-coupling factor transporter ATP-binding protein EcfA2
MISELKIRNFKSLESVDLKLGHFNLLVGANASGKSNFLDALRFLQGVGNGFSIDEILDGKPRTDIRVKWDGIRGGAKYVAFRNRDGQEARCVEFEVSLQDTETIDLFGDSLRYKVCFSAGDGDPYFIEDSLIFENRETAPPFGSIDNIISAGTSDHQFGTNSEEVSVCGPQKKSTLSGLPKLKFAKGNRRQFTTTLFRGVFAKELADGTNALYDSQSARYEHAAVNLSDMQFLDPLAEALRDYSSRVVRLGENGEGLASLIHEIENNGNKSALLEWLKELRPDVVDDIYSLSGLKNDFMVAIREGNKEFRAPALSEGTLRFIALAAAFFQPSMPKILVIEEIEKGLHPSRLRLLLEMMRSQSKRTGTQVFATTHSPTLLAWLTEEDRKTTFVCTRDADSGATKMRSLAEIPRFEELIEEGSHIDELFAEGWLESAPQ